MQKFQLARIMLLVVFVAPSVAQTATQQPEEKSVAVFGQTLRYWDLGTGSVVVLVHGLGSSKSLDWGRVVEPLSRKYRVLAPDQIGFGHSDKPLLDYRIQTYVDFLNEFLHQLKIDRASMVGESLGGWICAMYVLETAKDTHMVPVTKLVLVDAAGLKQDRPLPDLNPSTLEGMRKVLEAVYYDTSWLNDAMLRQIFANKLAAHDSYTVHSILSNPAVPLELLDNDLGDIHLPTLVVWGKQDALLPLSSGERYAAGIPGARLVSFDKCGHIPAVEKTEGFVSEVTAFLDSATPSPH
jgi:2-hydroxy-6-oxonona-2,4-dienedioate hydrolase